MKVLKYVKEKKIGLSIYLIFFVLLIFSLIKRDVKPGIYQASVILIFLIFLLSQYFDFEYRYFIGSALIMLIFCPFFLIAGYETIAEYFANYVYGFLVLGILGYFLDNLRERLKKKGYFKIYKIIILSISVLLLISPLLIYKDYVEKHSASIIEKVKENIEYRYILITKKNIIDSKPLDKNIIIDINDPISNSIAYKDVKIRGWAIDNSSVDALGIDKVLFFLGKKNDEEKFIGLADINFLREDVGKVYGRQFDRCGFEIEFNSSKFKDGKYIIYVYAFGYQSNWSNVEYEICIDNSGYNLITNSLFADTNNDNLPDFYTLVNTPNLEATIQTLGPNNCNLAGKFS